jgi:hypothetical protein
MNITLGYLKDSLAVFGFILALLFILLVQDLNQYRFLLIIVCGLGVLVDGVFTCLPELHHSYLSKLM